jgi:two-component system OmpR family response regulator
LVIDDDADMRSFLAEHLAEAGFEIQTAADGSVALEMAQADQPHVILLDMHMAPLDGKAVLARLRDCCDAPVVFLSTIADKAFVAESLWLGAADYVTKPFHLRELVARLRAILRRSRPAPAAGHPAELTAGFGIGLRPIA